jgi:hypothetical protein
MFFSRAATDVVGAVAQLMIRTPAARLRTRGVMHIALSALSALTDDVKTADACR